MGLNRRTTSQAQRILLKAGEVKGQKWIYEITYNKLKEENEGRKLRPKELSNRSNYNPKR